MPERISKKERQEVILTQLRSNSAVRISTLANQFGVSTETVRRDMDQLTAEGYVNRTYGGASAVSLVAEPGFLQRQQKNVAERVRIAQHAATLVEPDDVLLIDCGSTTHQFAWALATHQMDLTILTNCVPVAQTLAGVPSFRVIFCPGEYSLAEQGVYGHEAVEFLGRFQANKAIIGAGGLSEMDVTDSDSSACWLKRKMIEKAERSILLLDSSKLDIRLFETVCPLENVDDLVTDATPSRTIVEALATKAVQLHIAP